MFFVVAVAHRSGNLGKKDGTDECLHGQLRCLSKVELIHRALVVDCASCAIGQTLGLDAREVTGPSRRTFTAVSERCSTVLDSHGCIPAWLRGGLHGLPKAYMADFSLHGRLKGTSCNLISLHGVRCEPFQTSSVVQSDSLLCDSYLVQYVDECICS